MRRKWLLVAALLLLVLGFALALLVGRAPHVLPQPDQSTQTAPSETPMSPGDRVHREESGIGTTQLPRVPGAADRP